MRDQSKLVAAEPRPGRGRTPFRWSHVLWAVIYPRRQQRVMPTLSGVMLVALSIGIGLAAYNAASNILFITLSLLLACLVASGVMSWFNFRGLVWNLDVVPPLRVGADATVSVRVRNRKRLLPTYGLWFELEAQSVPAPGAARPETTFTANASEIRAALARAEETRQTGRLLLTSRLDPGAEVVLPWSFQPRSRGRVRIALRGVGSLFPFGFLRKELATDVGEEPVVWPAPIAHQRRPTAAARRVAGGERVPRAGQADDLFALRRYALGDSHRLIHWKASARTGELLIRQFAAENADTFSVWLQTDPTPWTSEEQYELLLRFAVAVAEDLFRRGQLSEVALDHAPAQRVARQQELAAWLDQVSVVPAWSAAPGRVPVGQRPASRRNVITFVPEGSRGVAARVAGEVYALA